MATTKPRIIFEQGNLRVVLRAKSYHGSDDIVDIEGKTTDAMGQAAWHQHESFNLTTPRGSDHFPKDRLLALLLRERMAAPVGEGLDL
jgi:G:T-mismatch repair DNA endonuclease (very short patch repair protein)